MKNHGWFFRTFITFLLTFLFSWQSMAEIPGTYRAGEYVVKLKNQAGTLSMASAHSMGQQMNAQVKSVISTKSRTLLVERSLLERAESVLTELNQNPMVERAEPNYIYHASVAPNDANLGELWGLINQEKSSGGVDIDASLAWDITQGSRDVVVAVIDTGVNYNQPDLINNMWVNEAEKNGQPGVDDDGNGFVDDIHGYDFANNDGDPMDDNDHGSHCAGTIGAEGDNGIGVVGVNWQVKIMALKFLKGSGGGTLEAAIQSIDYATQMKADIMSNSWGGGGRSEILKESIERAEKAGILFVAAAGNDGKDNDARPSYPANYEVPNVISVAAIDRDGNLANFSNYGRSSVHIAAPGVDILSTGVNGLENLSGTSMATPHVSGVAALMLAHEKNLDYTTLKERILNTSVKRSNLNNKIGYGVLNAYNAVTNSLPAPDPNDPANWANVAKNVSTVHPYLDNSEESFNIQVPGASRVSVHFEKFDTERGWDKVFFYDGNGVEIGVFSGNQDDTYSPVAEGDTIVVKLVSDNTITRYGFDIDKVAYQGSALDSQWRSVVDNVSTNHPYDNFFDQEVVFEEPGASQIRVRFGQFVTEKNYDYVFFYDGKGKEIGRWDGDHSGELSPIAQGDKIVVRLKTDFSVTRYGFDIEGFEFR